MTEARGRDAATQPNGGARASTAVPVAGRLHAAWHFPPDVAIAVGVFAVGVAVGAWADATYLQQGGQPGFYQREFAPAVLLACGRGFHNLPMPPPPLKRFLDVEVDAFDCGGLPEPLSVVPLTPFQRNSPYLLVAAALVWMSKGVSWSSLALLAGLLFGTVSALSYAILRLGMGRLLALGGAVAVTASTLNLSVLPHLRDYAKAPFILASVLLMGQLVSGPTSWGRVLALTAGAGTVVGIGFGFRTDLLVAVVPLCVVVLFLLPGGFVRTWRQRVGALLVFLVSFLGSAAPVLSGYSQGNNTGHVVLLGLMTPFDAALGVVGSLYQLGHLYDDDLASALIQGYATHQLSDDRELGFGTVAYNRAAVRYLGQIARILPGDLLTRAYAAIPVVLHTPFEYASGPSWIDAPLLKRLYQWRAAVMSILSVAAPVAAAATLLMLAASNLRLAASALVILIGFAGTSALQFHWRHFFHDEVLAWWGLGFVTQRLITSGRSLWQRAWPAPPHGWRLVRRGLTAALATVLLPLVMLGAARGYQDWRVSALFGAYLAAPREALTVVPVVGDGPTVLLEPRGLFPGRPDGSHPAEGVVWTREDEPRGASSEYLVAEFRSERCPYVDVAATLRYDHLVDGPDFSRTVRIGLARPAEPPAFLFFSAYALGPGLRFRGVELASPAVRCLAGLSRVRGLSALPLLLDARLSSPWPTATLHQTFAWEPRKAADRLGRVYTIPEGLSITRVMLEGPAPELDRLVFAADIVRVEPGGRLSVSGRAAGRFSYLLTTDARRVRPGTYLLARGSVSVGGVVIGLLRDDRWAHHVEIVESGPFLVVIRPDGEGPFTLVVANHLPGILPYNRLVLDRLGWIRGPDAGVELMPRLLGLAKARRVGGGAMND